MDATCVYGKIEGHVCILPTELVMSGTFSGKCTEDGYSDYEVSPQSGVTDQSSGVVSSAWTRTGILSLPPILSESSILLKEMFVCLVLY